MFLAFNSYGKFYNSYIPPSLINFAAEIVVMNKKKVIGFSVFFFVLVFVFLVLTKTIVGGQWLCHGRLSAWAGQGRAGHDSGHGPMLV